MTGGWMSVEAFSLLLKVSKRSLEYNGKKKIFIERMSYLLGWGVPAVIVGLSSAIGFATNSYMKVNDAYNMAFYPNSTIPKYDYCWLSATSQIRLPAVIAPLVCSVIFNTFVAAKVVYVVVKMNKENAIYSQHHAPQEVTHHKAVSIDQLVTGCKALGMLFPPLGIQWVFSFLSGISYIRKC